MVVTVEPGVYLIDSLLEFSRTRESLRPSFGSVKECVEHVVQTLSSHPEFHRVQVNVTQTPIIYGTPVAGERLKITQLVAINCFGFQ